jgi:hypothetical protein
VIFEPSDKALIAACLPEIGAYVVRIEAGRPLSTWSREEVLGLIEAAVGGYFDALKKAGFNDDLPM